MVLMDGHVHFAKPENGEDRSLGRDSCPWVDYEYKGKTLWEFAAEHPEYEGNETVEEIMLKLQFAEFPALPHVVDKLYLAKKGVGPEKLVLLTIDYPGSPTPTHEEMLRLAGEFPQQIIGSVSVNPNRGDAAALLRERLKELVELNGRFGNGWRPVVKFHPLMQRFDPGNLGARELGKMYALMDEVGAVLVAHTGVFQTTQVDDDIVIADPARLTPVAERYQGMNIVLAHMGTPDMAVVNWWAAKGVDVRHFDNALEMVSRYPHVYGDLGGLLWTGDRPQGAYGGCEKKFYYFGDRAHFGYSRVAGILEEEGRWKRLKRVLGREKKNPMGDKLLYGSGSPITHRDDLERQKRKLGGFNPAKNTEKAFRKPERLLLPAGR
ncbi:MAG: amidohydrolase family protein [Candidatus ainarchaeum sp.]|nr:amidohydrolase family protein [Candidatus ainarchaeum sp.]